MASSYVRNLVKIWAAQGAVPFYNTENEEQAPTESTWMTVEWSIGARDNLTFCEDHNEVGEFRLVLLGPLGVGDSQLVALAEQEAELLLTRQDPNNLLQLMGRGVPDPFPTHKNLFCVAIPIDYEYHG